MGKGPAVHPRQAEPSSSTLTIFKDTSSSSAPQNHSMWITLTSCCSAAILAALEERILVVGLTLLPCSHLKCSHLSKHKQNCCKSNFTLKKKKKKKKKLKGGQKKKKKKKKK